MRLSSLRYLIKEGFRNLWHNRVMGIASIGVLVSCLLLSGAAYLIFANVENAFDWAYKQNIAIVWSSEGATAEKNAEIEAKINSLDNVQNVRFISKEEMLSDLQGSLGSLYEEYKGDSNPLLDGFEISFVSLDDYEATVKQISQIDGVSDISYDKTFSSQIKRVRDIVFIAGGWIIAMLLLVSLFIIANTIKLTVYNRRLEISIMKSVGATNAFVRLPFVVEGIMLGAISSAIAYAITYFVYTSIVEGASLGPISQTVQFADVSPIVLAGFLIIGIFTGMAGSAISISKYLKDEGGVAGVI